MDEITGTMATTEALDTASSHDTAAVVKLKSRDQLVEHAAALDVRRGELVGRIHVLTERRREARAVLANAIMAGSAPVSAEANSRAYILHELREREANKNAPPPIAPTRASPLDAARARKTDSISWVTKTFRVGSHRPIIKQ
jgi:hypothetical protein